MSSLVPLKRRNYATFWTGGMVSDLGTWVQLATVGTLLVNETGKAASAGIAAAATFAPQGIAAPIGGLLADRFDRRKIFLTTLGMQTIMTTLLAVVIGAGERNPNMLALIILFQSGSGSLGSPSMQSILPVLVPPEEMLAASSLGLLGWNIGRVAGPIMAALLAPLGAAWAIGANAASFVVLWFGIATLRGPFPPAHREQNTILRDLRDGMRALVSARGCFFAVFAAAALHMLIIPFMGFAPVFARRLLGAEAAKADVQDATSLLLSAQGLGAVLGGLMVTSAARQLGRSNATRILLILSCLFLTGYVLAGRLLTAAVLVFLLGGSIAVVQSIIIATNQRHAPVENRGRVLSWWQGFVGLSYGLGLWAHGRLGDVWDVRWTLITAAGIVFVGGGLFSTWKPRWQELVDIPHLDRTT